MESLLSENRSNIQIPFISSMRNLIRRCSFCKHISHNILTCNDSRLIEFENLCSIKKCSLTILNIRNNNNYSIFQFKQWLCSYYLENEMLVKSFAISRCGAISRNNISICVDKITDYIYENNETSESEFISLLDNNDNNIINNIHNDNDNNIITSIESLLILYNNTQTNNNNQVDTAHIDRDILISYILFREQNIIQKTKYNITLSTNNLQDINELNKICECSICYEDNLNEINFVKLNCNHEFCKDCLIQVIKKCNTNNKPCCALCRSKILSIETKSEYIKDEFEYLLNYKNL